jgi:hypothetical protein
VRSPCKGNTFFGIDNLGCEAKVSNFDLFVFDEDICRFNITVHEIFGGKVVAGLNDLAGEVVDLLLVSAEIVILDIFFEIAFAILKK